MTDEKDRSPRIKHGSMLMATKDGSSGEVTDYLLTNSYMERHVQAKPEYWTKLNEMLYANGRVKRYAGCAENVVEKFSLLLIARDLIQFHEVSRTPDKRFFVKHQAYSFVFLTKAFLDSIAAYM